MYLTLRKMATGPRAVVIAGPSGVGKGTLIQKLRQEFPSLFGFSVSHTSRAARPGEKDGEHYHFTTAQAILEGVSAGHFLEHAQVHGRHYGTSLAAVRKVRESGRVCVLDIDVQGCREARRKELEAVFIFVAPPSMQALETRLRERGTENDELIALRLGNAKREMDARFELSLFDHVLVNDDLQTAYQQLKVLLDDNLKQALLVQSRVS